MISVISGESVHRRQAMWGKRVVGLAASLAAMLVLPLEIVHADTQLVRLTPVQYQRTIRDVFGPSIQIVDNKVQPGFRDEGLLAVGERKLTISSAELEQYQKTAQSIAAQVVDARRRDTLVNCAPKSEGAPDSECAAHFLSRVGLLLMRRPLSEGEVQAFVATHIATAEKLGSFNAGLSAALEKMLVDPELLFRIERTEVDPARPGKKRLDAYSMASRLSFFLWDSTPDAELLTAAQSGKLHEAAELARQVERMVNSSRMEQGLRTFFADMLHFDQFGKLFKDTMLYPAFTKNVQEDAQEQTLRTVVDQLLYKDREYRDLFTTRETFLTPSLAALYGVSLPRAQELGGAVPWVAHRFDEKDPYIGILSHASFLSLNSHPARSSPTLRGKALREVFLCQKVPAPPGEVDFNLVQDTSNPKYKTVRQRLSAHASDGLCAGCHKITDPMGLAMENFTTAAGYRKTESGAVIDATGSFNSKNFDGMQELAATLRDDPGISSCIVRRAYSFGTARIPGSEERRWLDSLQKELVASGGIKWRSLARRLALSPEFYAVAAEQPVTANSEPQ